MNLFALVFRLTHHRNPHAWTETMASFTGKSEAAVVRTRMGPRRADYKAYEIVYHAGGELRHGWYSFHPLPDPDPEEIRGKEIRIRYRKRKPFIFETVNQ
ncbi:MAG: hypothetical protein IIY55_01495 [Blautia sp.]|nr:hypothetical protein [Blautia sp.]